MRFAIPVVLTLLVACGSPGDRAGTTAAGPECDSARVVGKLPAELNEVSGITASRTTPGIFWAHNDDDPAFIYALDTVGTIKARVRVVVKRNRDWEDIAAAPCGTDNCLYVADIGDNKQRLVIRNIYRIREPALTDSVSSTPERIQFRTPGKSHDAEAIAVLPDDEMYLITKGRSGPVTVFAFPKPLAQDTPVDLTEVETLTPGLVQLPDMVTAASVVPGTRIVAVRTYSGLQFYRAVNGTLEPVYARPYGLGELNEPQGEGVSVREDGSVFLVSERAFGKAALLSRLKCRLPQ